MGLATLIAVISALIVTARAIVSSPANLLTRDSIAGTSVVIKNVRVFDGKSSVLRDAHAIIVGSGIIEQIYWSSDGFPSAHKGKAIDGNGQVLMPGLIDFHAHLGFSDGRPPWAAKGPTLINVAGQREAFIYAGVTTVVEGSVNPMAAFEKRPKISPNVFAATRMLTALEGHPIPMIREFLPRPMSEWSADMMALQVSSIDAQTDEIRNLAREPGHHIKVIFDRSIPWGAPRLSPSALEAIIKLAHAEGKLVYVHIGSSEEALIAARAGADVLMHPPFVDKINDETLSALAEIGAPVVTTAQIWQWLSRGVNQSPPLTQLEKRLSTEKALEAREADWRTEIANYNSATFTPEYLARVESFEHNLEHNLKRLYAAGVPLIAGTDTGLPGLTPGASLLFELGMLQDYGIPANVILQMATSRPGALLSSSGPKLGIVQEGARADLILVDGNPLSNIRYLENVSLIMVSGEIFRRR